VILGLEKQNQINRVRAKKMKQIQDKDKEEETIKKKQAGAAK